MSVHCFIDIGSNSVRALLVRDGGGELALLDDVSHITRLAHGLPGLQEEHAKPRTLLPEATEATILAVREIQRRASSRGAEEFHAVSTWALRTAEGGATDAEQFLSQLLQETGISTEVLPAEEECRLAFVGATASVSLPKGLCLVVDIGGGTLNITWGMSARPSRAAEVKGWVSLPIGARAASESFFHHDPPSPPEVEALSDFVRAALSASIGEIPRGLPTMGCGGVFTTLAALHQGRNRDSVPTAYDRKLVHGSALPVEDLSRMREELVNVPFARRALLPGVGKERADIIHAGAVLAEQTARQLAVREVVVSDDGLLWGFVVNHLDPHGVAQTKDRRGPRPGTTVREQRGPRPCRAGVGLKLLEDQSDRSKGDL